VDALSMHFSNRSKHERSEVTRKKKGRAKRGHGRNRPSEAATRGANSGERGRRVVGIDDSGDVHCVRWGLHSRTTSRMSRRPELREIVEGRRAVEDVATKWETCRCDRAMEDLLEAILFVSVGGPRSVALVTIDDFLAPLSLPARRVASLALRTRA